jgi:hypothetical protein
MMRGMALVTFKEIDDNRGAEIGEDAVVTRRRAWYFVYDSHQVSEVTVINDFSARTGIRRYTTYVGADGATDPTCRADRLTAEQTKDFGKWVVRATYTSGAAMSGGFANTPRLGRERAEMARRGLESGGSEQPPADPRQRPPSVRWGVQEGTEEGLRYDPITEAPALNTSMELFNPPIPVPTAFLTLTIERNEAAEQYSARNALRYINKVNANEFFTFPTKQVLCKSITADLDVEGEFAFWRVTYLFWIREDTWVWKQPNVGYREILEPGGEPTEIFIKGVVPSSPVPLKKHPDGTSRRVFDEPDTLEFNRFKTIDFTPLGL